MTPEQEVEARALGSALDWTTWERTIADHGITLDRPRGSRHPVHREIVYPIDYGYVNDTVGADGEEVDVFVGTTAGHGLVGAIITVDHRKGDIEVKLLVDTSANEVYLVNGFINFDKRLMEGILVLRRPMEALR